tara:strand:+ start:117 stop:656 length:540 start_codon:yes stop_codon:yes gene_type:complete
MTKRTFKELYSKVDPFRDPDLDLYEEYNIVTQEQLQDVFTEQEVNAYLQNSMIFELDVKGKSAKKFRLVSKAVRKKMAIRMKKLTKSASFKAKVARSKLRVASPTKLLVKAKKAAKMKFAKRLYPKYNELSPAAKMRADQQILGKFGGAIQKVAKRMLVPLKKKEKEKVKSARLAKQEK